jgi:organic radical activating enzyme
MRDRSFCSAKWLQVSIKLQNATTHSCHHPPVHKISNSELQRNISAFHNTYYKKKQRARMLQGIRPRECSYCWVMEDQGIVSDRTKKSKEEWSQFHIDRINTSDPYENINPSYLEVSFSNKCQLACAYCNLETSSTIYEEYKKHGAYLYEDSISIAKRKNRLPGEHNQYLDRFWQYLIHALPDLNELRITGGEPFLDKNTMKLIDYLNDNPMTDLKFSINSNLSLPQSYVMSFIEKISRLQKDKKIKSFTLFTSLDNDGEQAEFIRYGLKTTLFWSNIDTILQRDEFDIVIMCTFGLYSVEGFEKLLEKVSMRNQNRLKLSLSRLTYPSYLSIDVMPQFLLEDILSHREYAKNKNLDESIVNSLDQFALHLKNKKNKSIEMMNLALFLAEYEKRKGVIYKNVFPGLHKQLRCFNKHQKPLLYIVVKTRVLLIRCLKYLFPNSSQSFTA